MPEYNVLICNALEALERMQTESVDCIVTSPPYYGVRDYGLPPIVWDGDPHCKHEWGMEGFRDKRWSLDKCLSNKQATNKGSVFKVSQGQFCIKCKAWRGCLGLEPHPDMYVKHLTIIAKELMRVLKPTGIFWLNIGDSYAQSGGSGSGEYQERHRQFGKIIPQGTRQNPRKAPAGFKPKDLLGIPWMIARSFMREGWYWRQWIPWVKPASMPEPHKDRPNTSVEVVHLFTKSGKKYYSDMESAKECLGIKRNWRNGDALLLLQCNPPKIKSGKKHHAAFPLDLITPLILFGCPPGGIVLDPFMGTGTTGIAALKHGRNFIGIEMNGEYANEIAIPRLKQAHKNLF